LSVAACGRLLYAVFITNKNCTAVIQTTVQRLFLEKRLDRKPGSVSNDDLSWPYVASKAHAITGTREAPHNVPYGCCFKQGLHSRKVASALVSSYLAFPSLPR